MYTNIYSFMLLHKKSASLPYCKRILQRGILRVKQVFFYPFSEVMREKLGQIIGCRTFLPTLRIYVDSKFMTSMNLRWTLRVRRQRFTFMLIHVKILGHFILETTLRCHNFTELGNSCWQDFDDFDDFRMDFENETDRDLHAWELM